MVAKFRHPAPPEPLPQGGATLSRPLARLCAGGVSSTHTTSPWAAPAGRAHSPKDSRTDTGLGRRSRGLDGARHSAWLPPTGPRPSVARPRGRPRTCAQREPEHGAGSARARESARTSRPPRRALRCFLREAFLVLPVPDLGRVGPLLSRWGGGERCLTSPGWALLCTPGSTCALNKCRGWHVHFPGKEVRKSVSPNRKGAESLGHLPSH